MTKKIDGIIIPVVGHCLRAEIAKIANARGTLTCMKEDQTVDNMNLLVHAQMYRSYAET